MPTKTGDQGSVKILRPQESPRELPEGRITDKEIHEFPENCVIGSMVILEQPEPIRKKRRAR